MPTHTVVSQLPRAIARRPAGLIARCAAAVLAGVALAGCNSVTRVNTVEPESMQAVPQSIVFKKVTFDGSLGEGAFVQSAYEGRTPAGALRVQLQVANRTSSSETDFMWSSEWFDTNGMSIPGQNPQWTKVILMPGQSTTISLTAPNAAAQDWRVSMTRWLRK